MTKTLPPVEDPKPKCTGLFPHTVDSQNCGACNTKKAQVKMKMTLKDLGITILEWFRHA